MNIKTMTRVALCVAILCISSYIAFPLPFTPILITAQTVIVNLVALILTPLQSFAALGTYFALGLCGLPVFSGGTGGIGKLFSPTGGFCIGFIVAAVLISLLKGKNNQLRRYIPVTIFVGIPVIYAFAVLFMCVFQQADLRTALLTVALPFLFGDTLKCIAASFLAVALNKALVRLRFA